MRAVGQPSAAWGRRNFPLSCVIFSATQDVPGVIGRGCSGCLRARVLCIPRIVSACAWRPRGAARESLSCVPRFGHRPAVGMLCRLCGRLQRPLPALQLVARGPPLAPAPTGGTKRSVLPVWAVASVSAVGPGGAGSWYEALATSAPVQGTEQMLLCAHTVTGLPWWGSILLTTVALRGAVTLPLAAYQHYILAKVRGVEPCRDSAHQPLR